MIGDMKSTGTLVDISKLFIIEQATKTALPAENIMSESPNIA